MSTTAPDPTVRPRRRRLTRRTAALAGVVGLTALVSWVVAPDSVSAATVPAVDQCNGISNAAAAAVECEVTLVNNIDLATGVTSSTLTTRECFGAPGVTDLVCTVATTPADQLGTSVTQCNGSGNAGGSTVTCTVSVVNNITGTATAAPATVNQCIGSGQGGGTEPTTACAPLGSTSGATVTQCNGSGNNGGASLRVQCTVGPSTQSSALPVTINQCNGSANGGGDLVTCTASITNNILAVPVPPDTTPDTTPGGGTNPDGTPVNTNPDGTPVNTNPDGTPIIPANTAPPAGTLPTPTRRLPATM